jgi:hypothetical protein
MRFYPADAFLRHVRACTNAEVPGGRVRLTLGGAPIGYVPPTHLPPAPLSDRSDFDHYVAGLARAGAFQPRQELFDVRDEATGAVLAQVDRGAIPLLGMIAEGVHVNGLVRRADGPHLWVGRRAPDKLLDPDRLDHITAGGIPAGMDAMATLLKEAAEEASLAPEQASQATYRTTLAYAMTRPEGLRRDRLYCYDLDLPEHIVPRPNDNEVVAFMLWPMARVVQTVAETDDFKFNVALVLIDLFLRLRLLGDGAEASRVAAAMDPLRR